jgi:hypothetical protein
LEAIRKKLGIKRPDTLLAKNWNNGTCSFPLKIALEICKLVNVPKKDLERNIIEVRYKRRLNKRGGNSGKPLKNPKFPIKVNKEFISIIGHICGDGSIPLSKKRSGIPFCYSNSQEELIEIFKGMVRRVFGDIEPNITTRDGKPNYKRPNYYLRYPTILSVITLTVFKGKTDPLEFPDHLVKKNEHKISFLKAIYEDEGYVSDKDKNIVLRMKSREFIYGCKNILKELEIKSGKVFQSKNKSYFGIKIAEGKSIRNFNKAIKLIHHLKKERIDNIIKIGWKFSRCNKNEQQT